MSKSILFIKNNKFFLLGFLVLCWVIFINLFPRGYVLVGGDTSQLINAKENFKKIFFEWDSSGSIFLSLFYFLDKIGFNNSQQLSFYLGIFVIGSYFSFFFFLKIIFNKANDFIRAIASIYYALNIYTLYIFSYAWGYSSIQFLYIFIPILTGLFFISIKKKQGMHWVIFFALIIFLASSGFLNQAFALSFSIFLFFLVTIFAILKIIKINRILIVKILLLGILSFLVNAYWILPTLPKMNVGVENLFSNNIELNWWLAHSSNPIIDTLRLSQDNNWYFPDNFPYQKISWLKPFFLFLTFIPIFIWLWGILNLKNFKLVNKKLFIGFSAMFIFLIMFTAKIRPPFEVINYYFYNTWGLNVLRGYEKFAIYTPFIFAVFFFIAMIEIRKFRKIIYVLIFLIIITPLPFFIGKIQQNMSAQFYAYKIENRNYQKADHSFLVKIPDEYSRIRKITNSNFEKSFITVLPNDNLNTWTDYPKWKLYGIDITKFLHNKRYICSSNFPSNENFFNNFKKDNSGDYTWFIKLIGMMNSEYVLFHKDAKDELVSEYKYKVQYLEDRGILQNLEENDYFILYEINEDYFFPYISWQKEDIKVESNSKSINNNFDRIKELTIRTDFQEINPKKYSVNFENNDFSKNIILAERYDPLWKAYTIGKNGKETEIKNHFLARGYANGWEIPQNNNIEKIIIEYYPTRLMWRGIWISGITVLFLLGYLIYYYYNKYRFKRSESAAPIGE